jgi:predicted transcriptional regulator
MNDMDPSLLSFIQTKVTSFIKWDLIRFLHENPHTIDSAANIARYTGRNVNDVHPELDELVEGEVLSRRQLQDMVVYSLSPDERTRQLIGDFVAACQERSFRLKAVYHIIRNMR